MQRFEALLLERGVLARGRASPTLRAAYKQRIDALVGRGARRARAELERRAGARRRVRAEPAAPGPAAAARPRPDAPERRYVDAISDGLRVAMRRDARVVLLGQDIAEYGGVFKVTEGFVEEFGKARVRNTPIIESGAVGARSAWRSTASCRWSRCSSATSSPAASTRSSTTWRRRTTAGARRVPVVIRAPVGGGTGAGPFHSQNVESWFTRVAGLKVVAPATPYDAKGLLLAAFEDGNPVLYLEHKLLYRSAKGPVPAGHYTVPIGSARVAREGRDATVVTYGVGRRLGARGRGRRWRARAARSR